MLCCVLQLCTMICRQMQAAVFSFYVVWFRLFFRVFFCKDLVCILRVLCQLRSLCFFALFGFCIPVQAERLSGKTYLK